MRKLCVATLAMLFVFGMLLTSAEQAQARPKYLGAFKTSYPALANQVNKKKCGICHPEKDKKVRNDYGKAVGKHLGKKNEKDLDKIKAAIKKAEGEKNADGKTFGDVIKGGNLP